MTSSTAILALLQEQPHTEVEVIATPDGGIECVERSFTVVKGDGESDPDFLVRARSMMGPLDRMRTPANGKLTHVRIYRATAPSSPFAEALQLIRRLVRLLPTLAGLGSGSSSS